MARSIRPEGATAAGTRARARQTVGRSASPTASSYALGRNLSATVNIQNLTNRQDITSANRRSDPQSGVRQVGLRDSLSATYKF